VPITGSTDDCQHTDINNKISFGGAKKNSEITARKQWHNSDENSEISATNRAGDMANGICGLGVVDMLDI